MLITAANVFAVWAMISCVGLVALCVRSWNFLTQFRLLNTIELALLDKWPAVSLIIPACNEETTIKHALSSLLSMDYPNLELIVVDDRSTDQTNAVVRDMQKRDPRIQLVEIDLLPEGWLGKLHAMHKGVERATGDWLLFSDADVHYGRSALRKAMSHALSEELDFLTVIPSVQANSFILKILLAGFLQTVMVGVTLKNVRNPKSSECVGGGAFNLVRRSIYDQSKGLKWLRLDVIDDTGLAMIAKQAGGRCDAIGGLGEIELEWYPSARAFIKGLEKNGFAIFQYSFLILLAFTLITTLFVAGFAIAPILSHSVTIQVITYSTLLLYVVTAGVVLKHLFPFSVFIALTLPISTLISPAIFLRSALIFSLQGGIYWRGTFYSKQSLIDNQRFKLMNQLAGK